MTAFPPEHDVELDQGRHVRLRHDRVHEPGLDGAGRCAEPVDVGLGDQHVVRRVQRDDPHPAERHRREHRVGRVRVDPEVDLLGVVEASGGRAEQVARHVERAAHHVDAGDPRRHLPVLAQCRGDVAERAGGQHGHRLTRCHDRPGDQLCRGQRRRLVGPVGVVERSGQDAFERLACLGWRQVNTRRRTVCHRDAWQAALLEDCPRVGQGAAGRADAVVHDRDGAQVDPTLLVGLAEERQRRRVVEVEVAVVDDWNRTFVARGIAGRDRLRPARRRCHPDARKAHHGGGRNCHGTHQEPARPLRHLRPPSETRRDVAVASHRERRGRQFQIGFTAERRSKRSRGGWRERDVGRHLSCGGGC